MNKLRLYSLALGLLIGICGMPIMHADPAVEKTYIEQFFEKNPEFKQYFEFEAGQEIDLAQKLIDLETAIRQIDHMSRWEVDELYEHFQKSIYEKLEKRGITSPSISYLRRLDNLRGQVHHFYESFFSDRDRQGKLRLIPKIIDDALKAEMEESRKGRICLYHGTHAYAFWNFLLYTEMWKVRYQRSLPDDFLFLRFLDHKTCDQDGMSLFRKFIDGRQERRRFLIDDPYKKLGRYAKSVDAENTAIQLSTNYSLFSSWQKLGESSLNYAFKEGNGATVKSDKLPRALEHFHSKKMLWSATAQTYIRQIDAVREKLEGMQNQGEWVQNFGTLIQLSVDPKIVDNIAYVAKPYGKPGNIRIDGIKNPSLVNISKALMNPQTVINAEQLSRRIGTVMITPDVAHTAMKKIKMRFFNGATETQMKEVRSELNGILQKMENALQREGRSLWATRCKTMDQCMKPKGFKL